MDVPTPINYQNIQINNTSKENQNFLDLNGVLVQFPYIDSLKEKKKKNMNKKIMHVVVVEMEQIITYVKFLYYI